MKLIDENGNFRIKNTWFNIHNIILGLKEIVKENKKKEEINPQF